MIKVLPADHFEGLIKEIYGSTSGRQILPGELPFHNLPDQIELGAVNSMIYENIALLHNEGGCFCAVGGTQQKGLLFSLFYGFGTASGSQQEMLLAKNSAIEEISDVQTLPKLLIEVNQTITAFQVLENIRSSVRQYRSPLDGTHFVPFKLLASPMGRALIMKTEQTVAESGGLHKYEENYKRRILQHSPFLSIENLLFTEEVTGTERETEISLIFREALTNLHVALYAGTKENPRLARKFTP